MEQQIEIPLNEITIAPNVRKSYDQKAIEELAQSIDENGLLQPVTVRMMKDGSYELIYGQRRFLAFSLLKEKTKRNLRIPAHVTKKELSETDIKIVQIVENIQREGLNSIDNENAIFELKKSGMKQVEIAQKLGVSKATVTQAVKAYGIRQKFSQLNFDSEALELPTSVIAEFSKLDDNQLKKAVSMAMDSGGSQKAAREAKNHVLDEVARVEREQEAAIKEAAKPEKLKKSPVKKKTVKKPVELLPGKYEAKDGNIYEMLGQIENEKKAVILQGGSGKFYKIPVKTFTKDYKKI